MPINFCRIITGFTRRTLFPGQCWRRSESARAAAVRGGARAVVARELAGAAAREPAGAAVPEPAARAPDAAGSEPAGAAAPEPAERAAADTAAVAAARLHGSVN